MTNRGILLIEDSATDADLIVTSFRKNQCSLPIAIARDGEQGLDYLYCRGVFSERTIGNPSLILLDVKMPRLDGFQVLERIKSDAGLMSCPVLMLTSSRQADDVRRAYEMGANGFVVKPLEYEGMRIAVRKIFDYWLELNITLEGVG